MFLLRNSELSGTVRSLFVTARRVLGFVVFAAVDFLALRRREVVVPKTLLLVRVDILGDYVLFRNFIEVMRKGPPYSDYTVTLCANKALREAIESLDKDFIDDFIWIERDRFVMSISYRFKMLRHIRKRGFQVAVHPTYSREFFHGDAIVRASQADERIGNSGDLNNMDGWQKAISDRYYTRLLPAGKGVLFEFYRNREFFEALLERRIPIQKPFLETEPMPEKKCGHNDYVVISPGARLKFREWGPDNFARIADFVSSEYGLAVVIIGTRRERGLAGEVMAKLTLAKALNIAGETDIARLVQVLSAAKLLICNDTATAHIAAALNTPVVVISNGNHFGRYVPYPKEVFDKVYAVFPKKIEEDIGDTDYLKERYKYRSCLSIREIRSEDVKRRVQQALK